MTEISTQKPSGGPVLVLICLFCLFGGLLSSNALSLNDWKQNWILCSSTLLVTCQLFIEGAGSRSRDSRWETVILAMCSAAMPFLLGFVTVVSVTDNDRSSFSVAIAIIFILSLAWPTYTVFGLAMRLRFNDGKSVADESLPYFQKVQDLLARLSMDRSLSKAESQQIQLFSRRLATAARLEKNQKLRTLEAVMDSLSSMTALSDTIASDRVMLAFGRKKNLGMVDQLIATSAFVSAVVSVGNWSRIPFAVSVSRLEILTFVIDFRLLMIAVLAVALASAALVFVSRTPRPTPPQLDAWKLPHPNERTVGGDFANVIQGLQIAGTDVVNGVLILVTGVINGILHFAFTVGTWLSRVFRHMARLVVESVTKAATWKLTAYICVTFFGFLALGAILGILKESMVAVIKTETGFAVVDMPGMFHYFSWIMFFGVSTVILVATSFFLNLLFDQHRLWPHEQLNDLLRGYVPICLALPVSGFVLWVVARVFPRTRLEGFHTLGLVASIGGLAILGYALAILYKSFGGGRSDGRRS